MWTLWLNHINIKEMWEIYAAAITWAPYWRDNQIMLITDSSTVEAALNIGRCKSPDIMKYLRILFWLSVDYNFTLFFIELY